MTDLFDVRCSNCGRSDAIEDVTDIVRRAGRHAYCCNCGTVFPVVDRPRYDPPERTRKDLE